MISMISISLLTVNAQGTEFINYTIKADGSVEPNNGAITHVGNNYVLTQNITGTITIQRDSAVFDGAGYTLTGNAVKGTYNLDDSELYLEAGFNLTKAWNVTVQDVRIQDCVNGITLVNAYYCRILNNTIIENAVDGIKIAWSSNNMVFWNDLTSNADDAIQLINAKQNNIMLNNMDSGDAYRVNGNGIQINGNCSDNKIKGNTFTDFDTGAYIAVNVNDNASNNIVSYNNFIDNKWNGTAIEGDNNIVKLNNFYNNGLISQGNNNCSGNYWENILPSVYDAQPLNSPVNTNITPEFIQIPQAPKPTPQPTVRFIFTPTPAPSATQTPITPSTNPTTTPAVSEPTATPNPTANESQTAFSWLSPLTLIAIIAIAAVLFSVIIIKRKK